MLPVQEVLSSENEAPDDPITADREEHAEAGTPEPMGYDNIIQKATRWISQPTSNQQEI